MATKGGELMDRYDQITISLVVIALAIIATVLAIDLGRMITDWTIEEGARAREED